MANNVYCTLQLNYGNAEIETEWRRVFNQLNNLPHQGLEYLDIYRTNADIADKEFMDDFIGSQEAIFEGPVTFVSCSEYKYIYEHEITSKWTAPIKFFEELANHLYEWDDQVELSMTYEDEFYMFAGCVQFAEGHFDQRQESGGWFKEQLDREDLDPGDFQDYVSDKIDTWRYLNET